MRPELQQRAADHMGVFELATRASVTRSVCKGNSADADRVMGELVRSRSWHRHRGATGLEYFTASKRPLQRRILRRRLALLAFSTYGHLQRPFLTVSGLRQLLGPGLGKAGLPVPAWRPCYLHRLNRTAAPRLSLVIVGASSDLNESVAHLDRVVSTPAFLPWWYLALAGCFDLTYLLPAARSQADELWRWLRRRPPLSTLRDRALPIPVCVADTPHVHN